MYDPFHPTSLMQLGPYYSNVCRQTIYHYFLEADTERIITLDDDDIVSTSISLFASI